jgi:hypothetical protein
MTIFLLFDLVLRGLLCEGPKRLEEIDRILETPATAGKAFLCDQKIGRSSWKAATRDLE